jgi:hypothetical protein
MTRSNSFAPNLRGCRDGKTFFVMTVPKVLREYVLLASLFKEPPTVGQCYTSPSGVSVFQVAKIRRVSGEHKLSYRLIGSRIKRADIPPDTVVVLPWPARPVGRPRAAEPPAPTERVRQPIVTRAAAAQAERKRILTRKRALLEPDHQQVEEVRIENGSVVADTWRDPDDVSPSARRSPRVVRGFKSLDRIDLLLNNGNINRTQARAARGFRRLYETGEVGLGLGTRDLTAPPSGFGSGLLPSEARSAALAAYQAVVKAIGRHLHEVALAIIIRGDTIKKYASGRSMSPSTASGYVMACLDAISDWFKRAEDEQQEKSPATINTGQYSAGRSGDD